VSIVDKVKGMLGKDPGKAKKAVDKSGDMLDNKTGGKYSGKIDKAQDKARDFIDRQGPSDPA